MPTATVTLFLALLSAILTLFLIVLVGVLVFDRTDRLQFRQQLKPAAVPLAAAIGVTATSGSLYLSEVAHFDPCRLCWVQRGFMYPAALLLVLGVVTRKQGFALVAGSLAFPGLLVSIFHRYEQAVGTVGNFCDVSVPCSSRWVNHFGFVTIPTMAGVAFAGIFALVGVHLLWRNS